MKINALIFRQDEDTPFEIIHGVEYLRFDKDWDDLVIKSYGLVNFLKNPFDKVIVFKIVEDDE